MRKPASTIIFSLSISLMLCGCAQETAQPEQNTPEPAATKEPAPETSDPSVFIGKRTEHTYENEYFGIRADFENRWNVMPDDQFGLVARHEADDDFYEVVDAGKTWHDLIALDTYTLNDIYVFLYHSEAEVPAEQLKEDYEKQVREDIIEGSFNPLSNLKTEVTDTQFLSQNAICVKAAYQLSGTNTYQKNIYLTKDDLTLRIRVSSSEDDITDELLAEFTKY